MRIEPANYQWLLETPSATEVMPVRDLMVVEEDAFQAIIERIDVGPDIRLYLTSATVRHSVTLQPHQAESTPWLFQHMALKGHVEVCTTDGKAVRLAPDRAVLFRTHDRRGLFKPAEGQRIQLAGYMIRFDRLQRILGDVPPCTMRPLLERDLRESHLVEVPVDSAQRKLARSLFHHRFRGPLRTIFLEGIVLQLFAMQSAATYDGEDRQASPDPERWDRAAILSARERLLADMRCPPTLGELAEFAGMSEKALNAGFRALFGNTVFATLRNARLDHARAALGSGSVTTKQVAFAIGYMHVTNFISAFTEHHGETPRQYIRRSDLSHQVRHEA